MPHEPHLAPLSSSVRVKPRGRWGSCRCGPPVDPLLLTLTAPAGPTSPDGASAVASHLADQLEVGQDGMEEEAPAVLCARRESVLVFFSFARCAGRLGFRFFSFYPIIERVINFFFFKKKKKKTKNKTKFTLSPIFVPVVNHPSRPGFLPETGATRDSTRCFLALFSIATKSRPF